MRCRCWILRSWWRHLFRSPLNPPKGEVLWRLLFDVICFVIFRNPTFWTPDCRQAGIEPFEHFKLLTLTLKYTNLLPSDFHPDSRVWIYQSDRQFTEPEQIEIDELLQQFTNSWTSHGAKVKGFGKLFYNQFIILMADETASGVSGCSTDSSVRLIKEIEIKYKADLFNRQNLAFFNGENIIQIPLSKLNEAISSSLINNEAYYFNNVVLSKKELENKWIVPLKNSWLQNKIQ